MELLVLLQTREKAVIGVAAVIFIFYILILIFALTSCKRFNKLLKSYETAIKMSTVETVTLIRELASIIDHKLDEETIDRLDEIEALAGQNIVKGNYKETYSIYLSLYNYAKTQNLSEETLEKVEINLELEKEIDKLYQQALLYHNNDVAGYNYWVRFLLTRPFTKLCKYNVKENIF